jgi:hypothetical protein
MVSFRESTLDKLINLRRFSSGPAASLLSAGRVFYVNPTPAATRNAIRGHEAGIALTKSRI